MHAVGVDGVAHRWCNKTYCVHQMSERFVISIKNVFDLFLRDDECVSEYVRLCIEEGDRVFVFVDDIGGNLSLYDFSKYAVLHMPSSIQYASYVPASRPLT